jgi:radical SAM protein with 4Fe4S-binding SPASM domain
MRKACKAVEVRFGGKVTAEYENNKLKFKHADYETVLAVPYDIPIIGYNNGTVNTLRLWSAESPEKDFDLPSFSRGDYMKAVENKYSAESISQVLYPDDSFAEGRKLRLKQQYFFVSAGLQSIVRAYKRTNDSIYDFDKKVAVHINDTHPAIAIPELMRILIDQEGVDWDTAWEITTNTISYTNHTILSEALEKWPIDMFKPLLPRIYMIIEEVNERFCKELWNRYPGQWDKYIDYYERGKGFRYYHFLMDLDGGPCVYKRVSSCGSGVEYFAVTPDGELYPCHQFVGRKEYLLGNVWKGIINTKLQKEFSENTVYHKNKCRECWARFYCSGGCQANAAAFNNDLKEPYDLECKLQKKRIECAIMIKVYEKINK